MSFKDIPQGLVDAVNEVVLTEDDMPNDGVYHKDGNEDGPKKQELDDDCGLLPGERETMGESAPPDPKIEQWIKDNKDNFKNEYGEEKGEEVLYAKAWDMYNKKESVNENIAIPPSELANPEPRSAIGQRTSAPPKHVDVVQEDDFRPTSAEGLHSTGYRLLIQYSTNERPEFWPPLSLPAAPTLEALGAMCPGDVECSEALARAASRPCNDPHFKGNDRK